MGQTSNKPVGAEKESFKFITHPRRQQPYFSGEYRCPVGARLSFSFWISQKEAERRTERKTLQSLRPLSDVSALEVLSQEETGETGVLMFPYDEIVIHAVLTEAA